MKVLGNFRFCKAIVFLTLMLCMQACDYSTDGISWNPSLLAPLIVTGANVKDISDLEDKKLKFELFSTSLGYPAGVAVDVPPIPATTFGPLSIKISDYFRDVDIDSSLFATTITNPFPISIGAGTRIVLRSDSMVSNAFFSFDISQDIPPGGSFSVPTFLSDGTVAGVIYMYIEDFQTPGDSNVVFSIYPAEFVVEISFITIKRVRIYTDRSLSVRDTLGISIHRKEDEDSIFREASLNFRFTNELPVNSSWQMFLLDDFNNVIDSFFSTRAKLIAGETDPLTGFSISSTESSTAIPLDIDRLDKWGLANHVVLKVGVNTFGIPGGTVSASNNLAIQLKISGGIELQFGDH